MSVEFLTIQRGARAYFTVIGTPLNETLLARSVAKNPTIQSPGGTRSELILISAPAGSVRTSAASAEANGQAEAQGVEAHAPRHTEAQETGEEMERRREARTVEG